MEITQVAKKILEILQKRNLSSSDWPSDIYFPSDISKTLKTMSDYTNKEQFNNKIGAVGWEYAMSLLFVFDTLYISKLQSGNYENVSFSHSYTFKPEYLSSNKSVRLNIVFDDRNYTSKIYESDKLKGNINHGLIASFHTHPKYYHRADLYQYTFFSGRDISTLLGGRSPILGLIMGKNMWLACKYEGSQMIPQNILNEATRIEVVEGYDAMKNYVSSEMKSFGITFYEGSLGGKLKRL